MSMHHIPLTYIERTGLKTHGLPIEKPSQLSDSFRCGVAWAISKVRAEQVCRMELFSKVYADEDFAQDIESDISWIYETEKYKNLPEDEYGFKSGAFKVTITWEDSE